MKSENKYPPLESLNICLDLDMSDCHIGKYQHGIELTTSGEKIEVDDNQVFTFDTHPFFKNIGDYECEMPDAFRPAPETL